VGLVVGALTLLSLCIFISVGGGGDVVGRSWVVLIATCAAMKMSDVLADGFSIMSAELIQLLGPGLGDFFSKNRVNISFKLGKYLPARNYGAKRDPRCIQ
jgi:hypothetical protein